MQHISCSITSNALFVASLCSSSYPHCTLIKGHCKDIKLYIRDVNVLTQLLTTVSMFSYWKSKINLNALFFTQCSLFTFWYCISLPRRMPHWLKSLFTLSVSHSLTSLILKNRHSRLGTKKANHIFTRKYLVKWIFIHENFTKYKFHF